jgi:threonine dehydrogenase-like Zn-dependent dehydrogenase
MKAVTWQGKRDVRIQDVPDPRIEHPTDALIEITSSAICWSDLHLYEVLGPYMNPGDILGHEPMGIVEEVGAEVSGISIGRFLRDLRVRARRAGGISPCPAGSVRTDQGHPGRP